MEDVTPIILSDSVNTVRGGLTKAMFMRANTLAEKHKKVIILTFLFQQHHKDIVSDIFNKGLLYGNIEIHNMFESCLSYKKPKKKNKIKTPTKEKGFTVLKDKKQKIRPSYRYYKNGLYVMYKRFDENGHLLFIDYMDEGRYRKRREEYSKQGLLLRTRHMDTNLNKPCLDRYFDSKGTCYLTVWVNPETEKTGRATFFGKTPKEYNSLDALKKKWAENKLKNIKRPVVMTDSRNLDQVSLGINHDNLKRVAVIHNNHFKYPHDNTAAVRKGYKNSFDKLDQFDNVVFLTDEQKEDVRRSFGDYQNLEVIPHPAPQSRKDINVTAKEYDPYKVVTLARYEKQKRLDEAIEAFTYVVEKLPHAEYHIYGFGREKDNLQHLINNLGLQRHVKLKGFANDPSSIYKSAACSIMTSAYEGFGMVLTESLSHGTPAISYDSKYGPSDIIRDNIDGYLVPKGDKKELANKIISILSDKDLRERLATNAIDVNKRFTKAVYSDRWFKLMHS